MGIGLGFVEVEPAIIGRIDRGKPKTAGMIDAESLGGYVKLHPELKPFDETGIDQQPVEAAGLGTRPTAIEQAVTAVEDLLLLGE